MSPGCSWGFRGDKKEKLNRCRNFHCKYPVTTHAGARNSNFRGKFEFQKGNLNFRLLITQIIIKFEYGAGNEGKFESLIVCIQNYLVPGTKYPVPGNFKREFE